MKKIFEILIFIPNIPIMVIASFIIIAKIISKIGIVEFMMLGENGLFTSEFNMFLKKVYPRQLEIVVAIIGYILLIEVFVFQTAGGVLFFLSYEELIIK